MTKDSFRKILTMVLVLSVFFFLYCIVFNDVPKENVGSAKFILGYAVGVITTISGFYYGSSEKKD